MALGVGGMAARTCKTALASFCVSFAMVYALGLLGQVSYEQFSDREDEMLGQNAVQLYDAETGFLTLVMPDGSERVVWGLASHGADDPVAVADCGTSVATGVAVGLVNRRGPFADCAANKWSWAGTLGRQTKRMHPQDLVNRALGAGIFSGVVRFERGSHVGENLALSAAAVHDLLPVAQGDPVLAKVNKTLLDALPVAFDFRKERDTSVPGAWIETHAEATAFTLKHFVPGSNREFFVYRPAHGKIAPFIAMHKLVAVFVDNLESACTEYNLTPIDSLAEIVAQRNGLKPFLDLTSSAHWDTSLKPLTMMGYAAGIFEATGFCTRSKTMGVSASDVADSLAFLSAVQRANPGSEITVDRPAAMRGAPKIVYDANKVYVSHVVSDGDNLDLLGDTARMLKLRQASCAVRADNKPCAPRAWTISPRTDIISPALRHLYGQASASGKDSFILPPSGATYFYPASADDREGLWQQHAETVRAAERLGIEATVVWDFFFRFFSGQHRDYLRAFIGTPIKAVFWSAAPWLLSPGEKAPFVELGYKSDQVYRDANNSTRGVVVFRELTRWDGTQGTKDSPNGKRLSIDKMAALVASQPKGSLNFVYDISWTVGSDTFQSYADHLAEHHGSEVQLVDHRTLIDLARQKHGLLE